MNKLCKDPSEIEGCCFNCKCPEDKSMNFSYIFDLECFTLVHNEVPVSFRFKDDSDNIEVIVDRDDGELIDYFSLFSNLKFLFQEYPVIEFITNCYSLDESKLKFIEKVTGPLTTIEDSSGRILLNIVLDVEDLEKINKVEEKDVGFNNSLYRSRYESIILNLSDGFIGIGFDLNVGVTVSKNQGLMLFLKDNNGNKSSSIINLLLDDSKSCLVSNFKLIGLSDSLSIKVIKCFEKLGELEFIDSLVYSSNTDNKIYRLLDKIGYSTVNGYLVPKSSMIKTF